MKVYRVLRTTWDSNIPDAENNPENYILPESLVFYEDEKRAKEAIERGIVEEVEVIVFEGPKGKPKPKVTAPKK